MGSVLTGGDRLRRGTSDTADGPMVLLDLTRAKPRVRTRANGTNPAWAS
jgi:hypothetical protein